MRLQVQHRLICCFPVTPIKMIIDMDYQETPAGLGLGLVVAGTHRQPVMAAY